MAEKLVQYKNQYEIGHNDQNSNTFFLFVGAILTVNDQCVSCPVLKLEHTNKRDQENLMRLLNS